MADEENSEQQDIDDTEVVDSKDNDEPTPNRYNVTSYGWDSDVEGLVKRLARGDIHVPGFQRGFIWNGPEKSRFVESLILGLPVPNIFLAQDSKTKSLNIVDGQQRLRSLGDYLEGKFYLTGAGIQDELKGCYFSGEVAKSKSSKVLTDADARSLADAVLHSIVIKPDAAHDDPILGHEYNDAIIQIFHRLNTSGKPLSAQEIRTSIFYGPLDDLLRELNDTHSWRNLFGKEHSRLKDMELILRFIALRESCEIYKSPMPKFLDAFMEDNREMKPGQLDEIKHAFITVVESIDNSIGRDSIRSGSALTVTRFDAIMAGVDALITENHNPDSREIESKVAALEDNEDYKWSIAEFVNDTDRVKKRILSARAVFKS